MYRLVTRQVCRRSCASDARRPATAASAHGLQQLFLSSSGPSSCSEPYSCATHVQRRAAHASATTLPSPHPPTSSRASSPAATALGALHGFVQLRDDQGGATYYETHFDPARQHFLHDFCRGYAPDARDVLLLLMRVYTNLGRIDKVREVLSVGLRDLAAADVTTAWSPLCYASLGRSAGSSEGASSGSAALKLQDELLTNSTSRVSSIAPAAAAASAAEEVPKTWHRPSLLNASVFNAYLEALTRRNKFAIAEVVFLLDQMKLAGVARDALTYHYLVELHVRAGYDPAGLWAEMHAQEPPVAPLPATVQTLLLRVVPSSADPSFVVSVTKAALRFGTAVVDKRMLSEIIEQWLSGVPRASSTKTPNNNNSNSNNTSSSSNHPAPSPSMHYPPEYVLWLMLELEVRCVLEKASFTQYVQRQHLIELLLRCAKCTDAGTAEHVLALMDRHAIPKTADVLALVVWCWSQALEIEKTLDLVEWMALKGYLDQVDCFRKAYIDALRYTMDQHYLMTFADALSTPALAERALSHLQRRRQRGEMVTAHSLDLVVLGLARVGEERRALQLVSSYEDRWGVSPRTNTFNALLVGCSQHRSTMLHRVVYRAMVNSGVVANVFTFRVLIRQAVVAGNIDEAIFYLEEVTRHPGLRVEVEMILPILERAARVGDVETANRISQYSLKCDIGIDGGVLRSVMQQLTEAGQNVEVLKGQLPLHEALRSRSKTGRQRARNEVLL